MLTNNSDAWDSPFDSILLAASYSKISLCSGFFRLLEDGKMSLPTAINSLKTMFSIILLGIRSSY